MWGKGRFRVAQMALTLTLLRLLPAWVNRFYKVLNMHMCMYSIVFWQCPFNLIDCLQFTIPQDTMPLNENNCCVKWSLRHSWGECKITVQSGLSVLLGRKIIHFPRGGLLLWILLSLYNLCFPYSYVQWCSQRICLSGGEKTVHQKPQGPTTKTFLFICQLLVFVTSVISSVFYSFLAFNFI